MQTQKREQYTIVFVGETGDLRPQEECQLSVNVVLVLKVFNSERAGADAFHLDLIFPTVVNGEIVSDAIDKVFRKFHVDQSEVPLFVNDSASHMTNAAERLKLEKVRDVLWLDGLGEGSAVIYGTERGWGTFGIPVLPPHQWSCSKTQQPKGIPRAVGA